MSNIEFAPYIRRPKFKPEAGLALAIRLLQAAPKVGLHSEIIGALLDLREAAEALQGALRALHVTESASLRPYDRRFDGAWAGLFHRLQGWTRQFGHPKAARAQVLIDRVYSEGLAFLKFGYDEEWIHSRTLLTLIEEQGLEAEITELAGEEFLPLVREAHDLLGQVLGFAEGKQEVEVPDLVALSRALAQAIATYGRRMVGFVDEDDPASMATFEAAMAPRKAHLLSMSRRAAGVAEEEQGGEPPSEPELLDLDTPLPEIEA